MNEREWNGQMARIYYLNDKVWACYRELIRSQLTVKNFGMFLTAWNGGLRKFVKKKYNILDMK